MICLYRLNNGWIGTVSSRRPHSRSLFTASYGYSLIDVLICINILLLLIALASPSIQATRERARNLGCKVKLREIGLACQNHAAAKHAFPYTSTSWADGRGNRYLPISPHRHLVGYLDKNVFDKIDFDDPTVALWSAFPASHLSSVKNLELMRLEASWFKCPSDNAGPGSNNFRANMGISIEVLPASKSIESTTQLGAFVNGRAMLPAAFISGLSNTVLFSERVVGGEDPRSFDGFSDVFGQQERPWGSTAAFDAACRRVASNAPDSFYAFTGTSWLLGGYTHTWYNHVRTPNSGDSDCAIGHVAVDGGRNIISARSRHPGGVNSLLADGATRFCSTSIDFEVWRSLGTR